MPNAKRILQQDKMELTRHLESGPNTDCVFKFIIWELNYHSGMAGADNGGLLAYFFFKEIISIAAYFKFSIEIRCQIIALGLTPL